VRELLDYARVHFADEEESMAAGGIAESLLRAHKEQHQGFIDEVRELLGSRSDESLEAGLRYLMGWLAHHILGTDQSERGICAGPATSASESPRSRRRRAPPKRCSRRPTRPCTRPSMRAVAGRPDCQRTLRVTGRRTKAVHHAGRAQAIAESWSYTLHAAERPC
jgi:hypothetical protein